MKFGGKFIKGLRNRWERFPKRKKIQIVIGVFVVAIIGLVVANKYLHIFADTYDITNTAVVYWTDSSNQQQSASSNTVRTTITTTNPTSTLNIALTLQGRTNATLTNATLVISSAGLTVGQPTFNTDAAGNGSTTVSIASGTYDYQVRVPSYLAATIRSTALANPLALSFGTLKGGDLNGDGIINSLDFSSLNGNWLSNNATSDINKDGIVNSLDYSIVNGNWLVSAS